MRVPGVLPCLVVALAACSDTAPIADVRLRIAVAAKEVELGKAFPLTVVRTWNKRQTQKWNDEALAPLKGRLLEISRREDGRRVEETRHYHAYAFGLANVSEPITLDVKRALDPKSPGPPELPGDLLNEPLSWWLILGLAALAAFLLWPLRPTPAPAAAPAPPPTPPPKEQALERLARLRTLDPQSHEEMQSFYVEGTGLLRDFIGNAAVLTSDDLIERHGRLAGVLRHCDLVLFARHSPATTERERMLDQVEGFVRETA